MTLPTNTCEFTVDPIELEDLVAQTDSQPSCPYCSDYTTNHESDGPADDFDHLHRTIEDGQICRKLFQCVNPVVMNDHDGNPALFYVYRNLAKMNAYVIAEVKEVSVESIDDYATLRFGRKRLSDIKPKWRFRTKDATALDYTEYFDNNLVIGLEAEYDFRGATIEGAQLSRLYGVTNTEYHRTPYCPICGREDCWNHLPDNLIRAIERDSSIEGWEFILYGGRIPAEEFARRLPLTKIAAHFKPTWRNSLHSHAMIVHGITKIPQVVLKNSWQLFRFYYPGFVYLFGNFPREQGFLRSQPAEKDYVPFRLFNRTPYSSRWVHDIAYAEHTSNGGGMYFGKFGKEHPDRFEALNKPEVDKFDIEIRTSDSTLDLEQIIALRALTKALVVRAAQLSNFGLISVETDKDVWEQVKATTVKLNKRSELTETNEAFMKQSAIAFVRELAPFMSEYERTCIRHLIEKPIRTRTEQEQARTFNVKVSPIAKDLKRLITLAEIEADTEEAWVNKVAEIIDSSPESVIEAVADLKGYFDKEIKRVVCA